MFTIFLFRIFGIAMHLIPIMSRVSVLLIRDCPKRGDVEILAQSSIFPPPQVGMKLKGIVSR